MTTKQITGGIIQGCEQDGISIYKNIPYADTTAGRNRFREPQPVKPWQGIRDCTKFGPICPQNDPKPFMCWTSEYVDDGYTHANMSEDCLNLNVWTSNDTGKNPVIVYIHGGGNSSGSAQNDVYDGENIARKGIVFVSINYRVGIYGFLAYKDDIDGNYALKDQIAALQWVKENIAAFGGDPDNVTVAGQSAGSHDIQKLILSPQAAGLFQHAVCMSFNSYEGFGPTFGYTTLKEAQTDAQKHLSCSPEELRNMTTEQIEELRKTYNPTSLVIDKKWILSSQKDAYSTGKYNHVDIMMGCVSGDCMLFGTFIQLPQGQKEWTQGTYEQAVRAKLGTKSADFLKLYPTCTCADQIALDHANIQYALSLSAMHYTSPDKKCWQWFFSHAVPDQNPSMQKMWGAFHTGDVGYWFNHFSNLSNRPWEQEDYSLGNLMSSYLVNFARTGDPNGYGLQTWKPASEQIGYMHFDSTSAYEKMDPEKTHFWITYYMEQAIENMARQK